MTLPPITEDLTRWNRAGLSRVAYVDANAVTHLEAMRRALVDRFGDEWERLGGPGAGQDVEAVLARYLAGVGDPAWELLRAAARAMHVVSRHVDAYANETFLGTATQLASVRRIVSLLGYHPVGPSSAATTLTFDVVGDAVDVPVGTAARHQPTDAPPVVFETRWPLVAHRVLNGLVDHQADRSPVGLGNPIVLDDDVPVTVGGPIVLEHADGELAVASVLRVTRDADGIPTVHLRDDPPQGWVLGDTTVHTNPRDRLSTIGPVAPAIESSRELHLAGPPVGLTLDGVAWVASPGTVRFAEVDALGASSVTLDRELGDLPDGTVLGPAVATSGTRTADTTIRLTGNWRGLEGQRIGVAVQRFGFTATPGGGGALGGAIGSSAPGGGGGAIASMPYGGYFGLALDQAFVLTSLRGDVEEFTVSSADDVSGDAAADRTQTELTLDRSLPQLGSVFAGVTVFVKPAGAEETGLAVSPRLAAGSALPSSLTTSAVTHTEDGDIVVMVDRGAGVVGRASSVVAQDDRRAAIAVDGWSGDVDSPFFAATTTLLGHFQDTTRPAGWNRNTTPRGGERTLLLVPGDGTAAADAARVLRIGRRVVVARDLVAHEHADAVAAAVEAVPATVLDVDVVGPAVRVQLDTPVPPGITAGTLRVHGNAVEATHGETQEEKVLGSGAADQVHQTFTLAATDVSRVPDPAFPSGYAAALAVIVDGRRWTQVPTLQDAEPDDRWFTVRSDDEGRPVVAFGDGERGRRLPTGTDNVRVVFRRGAGLSGNLAPGSLAKLAAPVAGVDAVRQPAPASGGGEGEQVEDVRDNAPRSVLALGRAVSLGDHAALAARRSDVWQATSRRGAARGGLDEVVETTVVPSGGGTLSAQLQAAIEATLDAASPPGVQAVVRGHLLIEFTAEVTVFVDPAAFEPDAVRTATEEALALAFSVGRRRLGASLSRSEVLRVVEEVQGVERATVVLGLVPTAATTAAGVDLASAGSLDGDGHLRRVRATPQQLIALRTEPAGALVTAVGGIP